MGGRCRLDYVFTNSSQTSQPGLFSFCAKHLWLTKGSLLVLSLAHAICYAHKHIYTHVLQGDDKALAMLDGSQLYWWVQHWWESLSLCESLTTTTILRLSNSSKPLLLKFLLSFYN